MSDNSTRQGLVKAWRKCADGPLTERLLEKIAQAPVDICRVENKKGGDVPEIARALAGITRRGDELDEDVLRHLMDILDYSLSSRVHPYRWAKRLGFIDAVIGLMAKAPNKCITICAGFLRSALITKRRYWLRSCTTRQRVQKATRSETYTKYAVKLLRRSRKANVDLVSLIVKCLTKDDVDRDSVAVIHLAKALVIAKPMIEIGNLEKLIITMMHTIQSEVAASEVKSFYRRCIIEFCCLMDTSRPELESLLMGIDFDCILTSDTIDNLDMAGEISTMLYAMHRFHPAILRNILQGSFLHMIVAMLQERERVARDAVRLLERIIAWNNTDCLDLIGSNLPWDLVLSKDSFCLLRPTIFNLQVHCATRSHNLEWPVFQFHLASYFFADRDVNRPPKALVNYMRTTPTSQCVMELKERPFGCVVQRLLDPNGRVARYVLSDTRLEEKAFEVAWLAFEVGFQVQRNRKQQRDFAKWTFPNTQSRNRILGMHCIVWALGIASLDRFRTMAQRRFWLMLDLWQMVWSMIYD